MNPDDLLKQIEKTDKKIITDLANQNNTDKNSDQNKILNFKNEVSEDKIDEVEKNYKKINDFRQFVEMFYVHREGILHTKLYNDVTLISFKEGEVVLNLEKISDHSFNRKVAKLISTWTGRIWQIHTSTSNLGKSLYEEDIINQQKQIELMKNNIEIKKILKEFPDSKIHSITELTEVNLKEQITDTKIKKEEKW